MSRRTDRPSRSPVAVLSRRASRDPERSEAGDTLLEILIAMVVLGVSALSILIALVSSIGGSAEYRNLSTIDTMLRSAANQVTSQVEQAASSTWQNCTSTSGVSLSAPSGYSYAISAPEYWNGSVFASGCTANASILLTITLTHGGESWSISTVLYDPQTRPQTTAGAAAKLVFIGQPSTSEAGVNISPPPIIAVEDSNGNVVTNDLSPVTLAITAGSGTSGASLSNTCTGSEYYGIVTFNACSINDVGTGYTLTATDGSTITPATSNSFNVLISPLLPSQIVFTTPSQSGTASSSANLGPITVQELNSVGVPVVAPIGGTVIALSTSTPTTGVFATSLAGSAVSSVSIPYGATSVTFYYGDKTAGSPTLTLASSGLTGASQQETITPGSAIGLAFDPPTPGPVVAGGAVSNLAVAVVDSFGNVVTSTNSGTVTLSVKSGPQGTFTSGTTTESVTNGVASFPNLVLTSAGSYVLTATPTITGITTPVNSNSFTVTAGTGTSLQFTSQPSSQIGAGTTFSVVVNEIDQFGNLVTSSSDSVSLNLNTGNFATGVSTLTLSGGTATFSGLSITKLGTYSITATDTTTSTVPSTTSGTFMITPGPAYGLAVSSSSFTTTASNSATQPLTVALEDRYGNLTMATANTTITLASSSSGRVFSLTSGGGATTSATIANGASSVSLFYGDSVAGSPTLTFTSSGLQTATQVETVTAATPYQLAITSTAFTMTATSSPTQAFTVTLEDQYGNATTSPSVTALSLTSTSSAAIFATSSGGAAVNSANLAAGTTSISLYYADTKTGTPTITVSTNGFTSANQVENVKSATGSQLVITSTSLNFTATSSATQAFTVTLEDAYGNNATSTSATTLNLSSTSSGAKFAASSGGSSITSATLPANSSSLTLYYADTIAGSPTVTVAATGDQSATQVETISAGTGYKLGITSTAFSETATTSATQPFTVTLEDQFGNPTTSSGPVSVNLSSTSTAAVFSNSSGGVATTVATILAGAQSVTMYYGDTLAASPTLTAAATGLQSGTQVETITAAAPYKLVVTSTAFTMTATNSPTQAFTVTLEDQYGNPTTSPSATTLSLASTSSAAIFATRSGGTAVTSATLAAGSSAITLYYGDTKAGNPTISVTASGLAGASQAETVKAGAGHQLAITSSAFSATATNSATQAIVVTLEDMYGNSTTSSSATSLTLGTSSGAGIFATASGGTSTGTASLAANNSTVTLYYGDTLAGSPTLTISANGLTSATQQETIVPASPYKFVITSTSFTETATSSATQAFVATLEDQFGNATTSSTALTLNLSSTSSGATFATTSGGAAVTSATLGAGNSTITLYYADTKSGSPTISVASSGLSTGSQTETVKAAAGYRLVITTSAFTISAGTNPTQAFTVTLEDQYGNATTSSSTTSLTLASTSSAAIFATRSGGTAVTSASITAGNSTATLYYADTAAGSPTLTISSGTLLSATQIEAVNPGSASEVEVTSTAFTITAGTSPTQVFTVTLEDQYGNVTTRTTATTVNLSSSSTAGKFALSSGGSSVTSVSIPANTSSATAYYADTKAGSPTITVSATGLASGTQTETVIAAAPYQLVITNTPFTISDNGRATGALTIQLEDQYGNVAVAGTGGVTISLATSSSGGLFAATSNGTTKITSVTIGSGSSTVTVYYGDSKRGTPTITISSSGLQGATQTETVT